MSKRHRYNRAMKCSISQSEENSPTDSPHSPSKSLDASSDFSLSSISDQSIHIQASNISPEFRKLNKFHIISSSPSDSEYSSSEEDSVRHTVIPKDFRKEVHRNVPIKEHKIIKSQSVMDMLEIDQTIAPHSTTICSTLNTEDFKSLSSSEYFERELDSDQLEKRNEIIYQQHLYITYQAMSLVKTLTPLDPAIIKAKEVELPKLSEYEHKKTIIFDLDETLVHCSRDLYGSKPDVFIPIVFTNGDFVNAGIHIRPYLKECLEECSKIMEVIVFTASNKSYADAVLDYLDPDRELIHYRLYRDHCIFVDQIPVKDLRIIKNRNLKDLVIVDNCAFCFGYQLENGIPIIAWTDNKNDRELYNLTHYLRQLASVDDVRPVNRETFKLESFYDDFSTIIRNEENRLLGME